MTFFPLNFRPEAINLLSDIAFRNKKQQTGPDSSSSSFRSNATSPRRLKRGNKASSSSVNTTQSETNKTDIESKYELFYYSHFLLFCGSFITVSCARNHIFSPT